MTEPVDSCGSHPGVASPWCVLCWRALARKLISLHGGDYRSADLLGEIRRMYCELNERLTVVCGEAVDANVRAKAACARSDANYDRAQSMVSQLAAGGKELLGCIERSRKLEEENLSLRGELLALEQRVRRSSLLVSSIDAVRWLVVLVGLVLACIVCFGCSPEPELCSSTCVASGIAISADRCNQGLIRQSTCDDRVTRSPVAGESVVVVSSREKRDSIVLSVWEDGFMVSGPPAESELGSGIVGEDDSLLGIVEEYGEWGSSCSFVGDW